MRLLFSFAALALFFINTPRTDAAVSVADQVSARTSLLSGVTNIKNVGAPGFVAVFDPVGTASGQGAFAVTRNANFDVTMGAAIWGTGRILAFPHPDYLNFNDHAGTDDTGQLYTNSVAWAGSNTNLSVAIVTDSTSAQTWLLAQGFTNVTLRSDWENALTGAELLVTATDRISLAQDPILENFIQGGGGLMIGGLGWVNKFYPDPNRDFGNEFLNQAGLGWATGNGSFNPIIAATTEYTNATASIEAAQEALAGTITASTDEISEMSKSFQAVRQALPEDHPFLAAMGTSFTGYTTVVSATPNNPVSGAVDQALLSLESEILLTLPVDDITAHPTAETLYGAIPAGADKSIRTVGVNTDRNQWLSTGMYAVPGEKVTLVFPPELVDQGYRVQLSGHTDTIGSSRTSWERLPKGIARDFPIDSETVTVASAFGGAIYIDLGSDATPALGMVNISVEGAIQAPYFILGETTNAAWVAGIRNYPAPYAELECSGVILSVPSSWVRFIDDPESLMTFWNDAVARQDWVGAHESLRTSPERINFDVQISAGYLHSGYPAQGPSDYELEEVNGVPQGLTVSLERLLEEGDWGWFHELGHEMQRRPDKSTDWSRNIYTFDGDTEVTVNIFSNAALEYLVESPPTIGWGWSAHPDEVMQRSITTVNDAGAIDFDAKDPYPFYFALADGFGWETYRTVMAVYLANYDTDTAANLTNQQKKDLWLTRWSEVSGYNMVPYMVDQWKLEVSQTAIDTVNAMTDGGGSLLPKWMALGSSLPTAEAVVSQSKTLDLHGAGQALSGGASFVSVTQPLNGTLTDNGNGTYTYLSNPGFDGTDTFTTTYQSSLGNTQTFTTSVGVIVDDSIPLGSTLPGATTQTGTPKILDLLTAAVSPDGGATIASVSTPSNGTLTDNGDGTYTYLSYPGFVGIETITTTYSSTSGKQESFDTELIVKEGTVYHWKMDEASGSSVADSGPTSATGTTAGGPTWVTGVSGSALQFDGIDDQVNFLGNSPALSGYTDFTISAWIKTTGSGEIFKLGGGILGVHVLVQGDGGIHFFVHGGAIGQQFDCRTAGGLVNDGQWHHVVAQRDGYTGRVYIDGQLRATSNSSTTTKVNYAINSSWVPTIGNGNSLFSGVIDELRVHDYIVDINDSDGDRVSDTQELAGEDGLGSSTGNGPSDPFNPDSDNDGFSDGLETSIGTNANDAASNLTTDYPTYGPSLSSIPDASDGLYTQGNFSLREIIDSYSTTALESYSINSASSVSSQDITLDRSIDTGGKEPTLFHNAKLTIATGATLRGGLTKTGSLKIDGTFQCLIDGDSNSFIAGYSGLDLSNGTIDFEIGPKGLTQQVYIIGLNRGSTFATVKNLPAGYAIDYNFDDGSGFGADNIALVETRAVAYLDWILNYYPGDVANPEIIGLEVDGNQDGLTNAQSFLFGIDPRYDSPDALPIISVEATHLIITYRRNDAAMWLNPQVLTSFDLDTWDPLTGTATITVEDNFHGQDSQGNGIDRVTVQVPHLNAPQFFSRIAIDPEGLLLNP